MPQSWFICNEETFVMAASINNRMYESDGEITVVFMSANVIVLTFRQHDYC